MIDSTEFSRTHPLERWKSPATGRSGRSVVLSSKIPDFLGESAPAAWRRRADHFHGVADAHCIRLSTSPRPRSRAVPRPRLTRRTSQPHAPEPSPKLATRMNGTPAPSRSASESSRAPVRCGGSKRANAKPHPAQVVSPLIRSGNTSNAAKATPPTA